MIEKERLTIIKDETSNPKEHKIIEDKIRDKLKEQQSKRFEKRTKEYHRNCETL